MDCHLIQQLSLPPNSLAVSAEFHALAGRFVARTPEGGAW